MTASKTIRTAAVALCLGTALATMTAAAQPPERGQKGKGGEKGGPPAGGRGGFGGQGGRGMGMPAPGTVLPPFLVEQLKFSDTQKEELAKLQKSVDEQLAKILTPDQKKQLDEMKTRGPGGQGGPGGPGGQGGRGGRGGPPEGGRGGERPPVE